MVTDNGDRITSISRIIPDPISLHSTPKKKPSKEGFFYVFERPFTVLPRTSITTFVAVRQSRDHKSLHVIHLLPYRDCYTIVEAQTEIIIPLNIISISYFTIPLPHIKT